MPLNRQTDAYARNGAVLQLMNCTSSARFAPWQTWRIRSEQRAGSKGGKDCQGICWVHLFSLRATPQLCLSMGRTRTPRPPYVTIAQLSQCNETGSSQAGSYRTRLHFSLKSGTIRSTHRMQARVYR